MRRNLAWEIGAIAALLVVVAVTAANAYSWQLRRQKLNSSLAAELAINPRISTPAIRRLLSQGANIRTRGTFGETVLTTAACIDDLPLAKQALDAGVPVDMTGPSGTALLLATRDGSSGMVELLLARGAIVNQRDPLALGMTPLMHAAYGCKPATIRTLLAAGADATLRDDTGKSALAHARGLLFESGRAETVRLLKEALARKRNARVLPPGSLDLNVRTQGRKGRRGE